MARKIKKTENGNAQQRVPTEVTTAPPKSRQPELAGQLPDMLDYAYHDQPWNCQRLELLVAEFWSDVPATQDEMRQWLALFHEVICTNPRRWMMVRRLFGLMPANPGMDGDADDLRVWDRAELQESLGITQKQLQIELDSLRGIWRSKEPKINRQAATQEKAETDLPEDLFEADKLIKEHGFDIRFSDAAERKWFGGRVADFEKILREKFSTSLGWNILQTELQLRRLQNRLANHPAEDVGDATYDRINKQVQAMGESHRKQIDQLEEICPWAKGIATKTNFTQVITDITKLFQEYHITGDQRLIDGFMTSAEFQVEMRRSQQMPEVRYRAGLVVYISACRAGLWDPNFRAPFEPNQLKRIDQAFAAAARAAGDDAGEPLINLESEDPADEYGELVLPSQLKT